MELNYIKIIQTVAVLFSYLILRTISFKIIDKTLLKRFLQKSRGIIIKRVVHVVLLLISLLLILLIWGVNQAELAIFVGSVLTVMGVAFFAQWSILSNITSSILLFFNHPVRIDDSIIILEGKDYQIEGKVIHIGLFFITLQTKESEQIVLPNNIFIQKSIQKTSGRSLTEAKQNDVDELEGID